MQKTIKVIAVIAVILVALSMLALLVSIPLQRVLGMKIFNYPEDLVSYLPIFPLSQFLECLVLLGCVILLAVCAGKKGVVLPEILLLVMLLAVVPFLGGFMGTLLTTMLGNLKGSNYLAANSVATTISNYCMMGANLGNSLALVACGMNIVYKRMSKKLDKLAP